MQAEFFVLAILQGITEFLPVSSSGHLTLLELLLEIENQNLLFFNLLIHAATLLATITFYRHNLLLLVRRGFQELSRWRWGDSLTAFPSLEFGSRILLTTVVTGVIGITVRPLVAGFQNLGLLAVFFFLTGIILLTTRLKPPVDNPQNETDFIPKLSMATALIIGLAQGFAVLPGISRSGITITAGLLLGLRGREAMNYSILISIPIIIAAFLLELTEVLQDTTTMMDYSTYIGAFIISFIVGYLSLGLLLTIVKKHRIHLFAYYLIPLAIGLGVYAYLG